MYPPDFVGVIGLFDPSPNEEKDLWKHRRRFRGWKSASTLAVPGRRGLVEVSRDAFCFLFDTCIALRTNQKVERLRAFKHLE